MSSILQLSRSWLSTVSLTAFAIGACVVSMAAPALADAEKDVAKPARGAWYAEVGAGAAYAPDYEGSDDYEAMPLPLVLVSWRDTVTLNTFGAPELSVKVLDKAMGQGQFKLRALAGYSFGRDEDANDALKGLGDMEGGANLGLAADYTYQSWSANFAVRQDVSGDRGGLVASLGLGYTLRPWGPGTMVKMGPSVTWANGEYMNNTFGIDGAQAASSGYSTYSAGDGFKDAGFSVQVRHQWTERVAVQGGVTYKALLGDAADSPFVSEQGSDSQLALMMGLTYAF